MKTDIKQWTCEVIDASYDEFCTLIARIPPEQRRRVGKLKAWSPKDQISHLTYWIELFIANIQACRNGLPLTETSDYLAKNDAAWQIRKDWTWDRVEKDVAHVFSAVKAQVNDLSAEDLIDAKLATLMPDQKEPPSLLCSLLYELIDHPLHHMVKMYQEFRDEAALDAILTRMLHLMNNREVLKWSEPTLNKIREHIKQSQE